MIGREVQSEIAALTSDRYLSGLLLHSNTVGGGLGSRRVEEMASPALEWWRNGGNPDGKPVWTSSPETDCIYKYIYRASQLRTSAFILTVHISTLHSFFNLFFTSPPSSI
ncbi:hypothetical protein ACLB2K_007255 [Fragaria x ananassa]